MALQHEGAVFRNFASTSLIEHLSVMGQWRRRLESAQDAVSQSIMHQHMLQWGVVQS